MPMQVNARQTVFKLQVNHLLCIPVVFGRGVYRVMATNGAIFRIQGLIKHSFFASAPIIPENYENCPVILENTRFKDLKFHVAVDFNLCPSNICLGFLSHAALHNFPIVNGK